MNILVTGGAGYIGSITCQALVNKGYRVVVYDSLAKGKSGAVKGLDLVIGETQNIDLLKQVIKEKNIDSVMHFAAYIEMGESYKDPYKYFYNNVYGSLRLMQAMVGTGIKKIVFSSTAGVYGNPKQIPIKENDPKNPENPYGESKLMVEKMLSWFHQAHGLNSVSLRYFNAAGATLNASLGENHQPESHLIPTLIKTALGQLASFTLNGTDYKTADGTCIRDYVHVLDLASAHILALELLNNQPNICTYYNVGTGQGYSNSEVIKMVKQITATDFKVDIGSRRLGDADQLVADPSKIMRELAWQPQYSDLKTMVQTAWEWHKKNGSR